MKHFRLMAPLVLVALLAAAPAQAREFDCTLSFDLAGWSLFYKTASGTGTVRCNNGQQMAVKITTKGGGLSVGKSRIEDGTGAFAAGAGWRCRPPCCSRPTSRCCPGPPGKWKPASPAASSRCRC